MAGLLAVSWKPGADQAANAVFDRARDSFARLKGLSCNADVRRARVRIARFATPGAPSPGIHEEGESLAACAGWIFFRGARVPAAELLPELSRRFASVGARALADLQGQYLAVVMAAGQQTLRGAGDKPGFFPAFVTETPDAAWLCTSSIVLASALGGTLDVEALRALFMDSTIRTPRSAFAGIRRLAIGEEVELTDGKLQVEKVWRPFFSTRPLRSVADAAAEGSALLGQVAERVATYWPKPICDLTSGLDSRLIAAHIAPLVSDFAVTVSGPSGNPDVDIARAIADRFGWEFNQVVRPPNWGHKRLPLFDRSMALVDGAMSGQAFEAVLDLKQAFAGRFQACLGGGIGELYKEFFWQQESWRIGRTSTLDVRRLLRYRFFYSSDPNMSLFEQDWRPDYLADQENTIRQIIEQAPDALNTAKLDATYMWKQSGHAGLYNGSTNALLPSPLVLGVSDLLEFTLSLPWRFRMLGALMRHMITQANPALAALPTWYGGSAEPFRLSRPQHYVPFFVETAKKVVRKLGQIAINHPIFPDPIDAVSLPSGSWDEDFVKALDARNLLNVDQLRSASLYRVDGLRRFLDDIRQGRSRAYHQLWPIVSVELICRHAQIQPSGIRL